MRLVDIAMVFVGAGIGGALRHVIGDLIVGRWGGAFPWHTFAINISGAFLLGALMVLTEQQEAAPSTMRLLLGVGVLGGFTTFSTLSFESVALMAQGRWAAGAFNMFGSAAVGIVAAIAGMAAGRSIA